MPACAWMPCVRAHMRECVPAARRAAPTALTDTTDADSRSVTHARLRVDSRASSSRRCDDSPNRRRPCAGGCCRAALRCAALHCTALRCAAPHCLVVPEAASTLGRRRHAIIAQVRFAAADVRSASAHSQRRFAAHEWPGRRWAAAHSFGERSPGAVVGRGEPSRCCSPAADVGGSDPSPAADVGALSPVLLQMRTG